MEIEMKCGNAYEQSDNIRCKITDRNCVCSCWSEEQQQVVFIPDIEDCPAYEEPSGRE